MHDPVVSIVTPVLDGRRYLLECIESVLGQTYERIEHVFVDGGSADGQKRDLTCVVRIARRSPHER